MNSIKINIALPKASELRSDLNELLSQVKNKSSINLDLDITSFKTSISEVSQMLGKLKSQVSSLGGFESLINANIVNESTNAIEKQNNAIREQQKLLNERVLKTSYTTQVGKDGEDILIKDLEKIRDEYGNIIEVVNTYSKKTGEITSTTVTTTDEVEKQRIANEKLLASTEKVKDSLQLKLNQSLSNQNFTLIDDSVFTQLQNKINSINTETPEKEIRELQTALTNLGSSDSQIVRLQNAISKYEITISGLKDKYKNIVPKKEMDDALSKINILRESLERIQNGENYTNKGISSILNDASSSMKSVTTATKNASEQQRLYNKEVTTFGNAFKDILTKVGLFSVVYTGINKVQSAFREGFQSVVEMDSALANLNKVVELNSSQLLQMRDSAVAMGEALGRSAIDVAKAQAEFGRQYKDIATINEMTRASILGANVMDGVGADEVAKGLTTIISSMKLEAKDAIPILDSLNEVQNNYRVSASSMLSALAEVGSTAKIAGADIYQLQGYITAMTVSTGKSGDEIGNSLRSITSRIYKIGSEGISSEGKPEKMLQDMGVAVRDLEGNFRPLNQILSDLNIKWQTMTETQKIATAQTVAGVHRYNDFISLMNNFEMAIDSSATAMDSMGSATKENEIYLNSIEGRMSSLKATTQGFWFDFINSDMIKGGIDALQSLMNILNGLQNVFGSLGLTVGALSSAFLIFTNNPLRQFADDIVKHKTTLGGLSDILNQVKAKVAETGTSMNVAQKSSLALRTGFDLVGNSAIATQIKVIALQTVLSMGLSLVISGVISIISSFVSSLGGAEDRIESVNEKSKELSETLKSFNETKVDLSSYEEIRKKLEETILSEKEKNDLNNKLVEVKEKLYTLDDSAYSILNNQNLGYEQQIELLKQINSEKLYDRAEELDKELGNGFWNRDESKNAESARLELERNAKVYKEIIELQKQANGGTIQHSDLGILNKDEQEQVLKQLKDQISSSNLTIQRYNSNVQLMEDANYNTDRSMIELSSSTEQFIDSLNDSTDALDKNTKAKELNFGIKPQQSEESALGNYSDSISKVEEYMGLLDQLNEKQAVTPKLMKSLIDTFPEISKLGSSITNVAKVQEYLNSEIAKQEDIARTSYQAMMEYNEDYYNGSVKNTESWQNYLVDVMNTLKDINVDYYNKNAEGMSNELRNATSLAQARATIESNLVNGLRDLWAKYYGAIKEAGWYEDRAVYQYAGGAGTKVYEQTKAYLDQQNAIAKKAQEMIDRLNGFSSNISVPNIGGNFIGSSAGSSGSGSKATEKEIKNMERLSDRYLDLENSLKQVNNELDKNKTLMDNSSDEERLKYLDKEIGLLQRQKTAYENIRKERVNELSELRNSLSSSGFGFKGDGSITNANSRLDSLVAYANSLSGDSKENAQNNVEAIFKNLTRYNELLLDQIPEVENQILDLKNTTIDTQKEIVDIIKKQKDAYIENEEKMSEALKKEIQKRRDLRNSEWAEDDYKDELKKRQDTLVDLESQLQDAMRMADGELVKNIKKQIESAQQDINGFIRDNERDKSNDRFDEELDRLDENTQKKIDEINSRLTDEEILKMVQNGVRDLSTILNDVGNANQNITSTFSSVGSIIQSEWLGNLDKFIAELRGVSALDLNLNANVNRNVSDTRSGRTIGDINLEYKLVVEGGVNEDVLPKVEKMIKKAKDETIREVGDILINTR